MNTSDFSRFRKEPSPDFENRLYQKIDKRHKLIKSSRGRLLLFAVLLILGACVQQVLTPRQIQIGNFWVHEMSKKFICAGDTVYPSYTPSSPLPTPQPAPINIPTADLEEFRQELGINLSIPTWAPEGFTLQETEYSAPTNSFVRYTINWYGINDTGITMSYFPAIDFPGGREIPVLRGDWDEATVQGQPAVIIHGECSFASTVSEHEAVWNDNVIRLNWMQDGVFYELRAYDLDTDVLIKMAESAR